MNQHNPKDPTKIAAMAGDAEVDRLARELFDRVNSYRYSYNFTWLGRPVIQYPQDLVALQELIWRVRPDLIVETGIAHGGSLVFSASMLELLGEGEVLGVDIEIRPHNREAIEAHPLARRIAMIEGSSVDEQVVAQVREHAAGKERVLVILDSNHTHEHVARELELYGQLVTPGSYLIVMDTVIDDMPAESFPDRPWGPGNNPKTAVHEFLAHTDRFEIDREISDKLLITVAPDGYLKCLA
jgi:cephalosporin hydroxylase